MAFEIANFKDENLDQEFLTYLVDHQAADNAVNHSRLWDYFRNPMTPCLGSAANVFNSGSRPYFQAQEIGLPARITGVERTGLGDAKPTDLRRKEVVIENDIAWRIHTMVDFLFGKGPFIRSLAADANLSAVIEKVASALFEANGGNGLFQEMALLGSVYGFVDIALRTPADGSAELPTFADASSGANGSPVSEAAPSTLGGRPGIPAVSDAQLARIIEAAGRLQLETIEAPRVLPVLEEYDYRRLRYWVQRFFIHPARLAESRRPWMGLLSSLRRG